MELPAALSSCNQKEAVEVCRKAVYPVFYQLFDGRLRSLWGMIFFMAKLYFYYSAMNAGKTTLLLQSDFNYLERGMNTICFLPEVVWRLFNPQIESRIGLSKTPIPLLKTMDLVEYVREYLQRKTLACVLIDEAQFLSKEHVAQLCIIVDELHIPVLAYGLRTDFKGDLFEGSQALLAIADHLIEIKTICFCGKKATMTARIDRKGEVVIAGGQVECGGNDRYVSFCRKHHKDFYQGKLSEAFAEQQHLRSLL